METHIKNLTTKIKLYSLPKGELAGSFVFPSLLYLQVILTKVKKC